MHDSGHVAGSHEDLSPPPPQYPPYHWRRLEGRRRPPLPDLIAVEARLTTHVFAAKHLLTVYSIEPNRL